MLLTEVDMDISGRVLVKLGQNFDWVFTDSETDRFHLYKNRRRTRRERGPRGVGAGHGGLGGIRSC